MVAVTDLPLEHMPLETQDLADNPLPYFESARRKHPWLAASNLGWVITEYQAMKEVLARDEDLMFPGDQTVDIMQAHGTGWGQFTTDMMLSRNEPAHGRLRGSVAEVFTPRAVNRLRPLMRKTVADLLDDWAPKGAFNFTEFAARFPVRVMFGLIGADPSVVDDVKDSLEIHGGSYGMDPTRMPIIEAAYQHLWGFVDGLIKERGPNGGHDDLLDDLIAANTNGGLSDVELRQMLIFLFGAGYDTSKNQLTLITHSLLQRPDLWARCAEDRPYCDKVVEEGFRYRSPSNTYRSIVRDFEFRDVTFPAGGMLIFPLTQAGRDPQSFPNPETFDPERKQIDRHLAFGRGMHICLGQFLARANLEEGLHLIAQRLTNPRLAGEVTWRPFPGTWGIRDLPIRYDPAPRRPQPEPEAAAAGAA
jgi:cytochrome P450